MGDLLSAQTGRRPWDPSEEASVVKVYDRFNVPTMGVVSQHGVEYLFWCLLGHGDPASLWGYVQVTSFDQQRLEEAEDFDSAFDELVVGRNVAVALASSEMGILLVSEVSPQDDVDRLTGAAIDAINELIASTTASAADLGRLVST